MVVTSHTRDVLLELASKKRVYLEGNILKIIKAEDGDTDFAEYLQTCIERDATARKKRLSVTKQVQEQNKELETLFKDAESAREESERLKDEAEEAREEAERAKEVAETDLSLLQKKTQTELMGSIVKVALWVIMGVGIITTALYMFVLLNGNDAKIIESTWSNLFGILLTNSFSIIGTIMGVKHATNTDKE